MKSYLNPLEDLFGPKEINKEVYEGTFFCQQNSPFCDGWSSEAIYIRHLNTLTWVCSKGHVNEIEEYESVPGE